MTRETKKTLAAVLAAAGVGLFATSAMAFHAGGVAECEGCHTMHNSLLNAVDALDHEQNVNQPQFNGVIYLLKGSDPSSTCLNCHGSTSTGGYHILDTNALGAGVPPGNYTPGGDFAYLKKTYTWVPRPGTTESVAAERHGHNVVAADYGLVADSSIGTSPGGSFPAAELHCSNCHDPHGKTRIMTGGLTLNDNPASGYTGFPTASLPIMSSGSYGALPTATAAVGTYRLLASNGYSTKRFPGHVFGAGDAPIAVVNTSYNRTEDTADTRVAYGSGMSEWCQNCHASIHNPTPGSGVSTIHPAGNGAALSADVIANYNAYVGSGNLMGAVATSYDSMVPYETGLTSSDADRTILAAQRASTSGPDGSYTPNVMCLSCHRAHASAHESMTRWDSTHAEMFIVNGAIPGTDQTAGTEEAKDKWSLGRSIAENQAALYGRSATHFATWQRSLCNKCHAKD